MSAPADLVAALCWEADALRAAAFAQAGKAGPALAAARKAYLERYWETRRRYVDGA